MLRKNLRFHIGLRTIKTAVAVILAMMIVDAYGATTSKLIFAMLGAMAAVQPTFQESVESCLTQVIGVLFGAVTGLLLLMLPIPSLVMAGIGIVLVITLYNTLRIRFSPSLPCLIVVILCTTPNIQPIAYALGRIWDSTIGLAVGMVINMLVFPYDNSRRIRDTAESLDREVVVFLSELFDGDDILPSAKEMSVKVEDMDRQLKIFSKQRLFMNRRKQEKDLRNFRLCEKKARELVARMEILQQMDRPGRLDADNYNRLKACGGVVAQIDEPFSLDEKDIVTNYHVRQILSIRQELLDALEKK